MYVVTISKHTLICGIHFVGGVYIYLPTQGLYHKVANLIKLLICYLTAALELCGIEKS